MLKDNFELQQKAIEALARMKNQSKYVKESAKPQQKFTADTYIFEEYSPEGFDDKLLHDRYYYDVLLKEDNPEIADKILDMLNLVNEIYAEINIKPQIFSQRKFLEETSPDGVLQTATRIIKEHIDRNYYSLTDVERDRKYKNNVIQLANDLVTEHNIDIDSAVQLAQKKLVLENLLLKISFPMIARTRIEHILESGSDMFTDTTRLSKLWESFSFKLDELSLLLSTYI